MLAIPFIQQYGSEIQSPWWNNTTGHTNRYLAKRPKFFFKQPYKQPTTSLYLTLSSLTDTLDRGFPTPSQQVGSIPLTGRRSSSQTPRLYVLPPTTSLRRQKKKPLIHYHVLLPNPGTPHLQPSHHRWELTVLRYHRIRVNHPYPFWGVMFWVILHDFVTHKYHKNSQIFILSPSLW